MQTFALHILHDEVDVLSSVDGFVEFHNAVVVKSTENSDFANRLLFPLDVHELHSVVLFDRDFFAARLVKALLHHGIRTRTNLLAKMVVIEVGAVWC